MIITIEQAVAHVREDSDLDAETLALLQQYINAAEQACARLANRGIYADLDALQAAQSSLPGFIEAAYATYDADVEYAETATDERVKQRLLSMAQTKLNQALRVQDDVLHGIVATDDIKAAILLVVGHFYNTREEVVTGQGAAAVQVPMAAAALMERYIHFGDAL